MENVNVAKRYFEYLRSGNLDALGQLFSDDIIWHQPGRGKLSKTYRGKKELFDLFGQFMNISQGSFKIDEVKNIMTNGDWVAATLHFSAKKRDQSISMDGVDLMKIENSKIKEVYLFSTDQDAEDRFWT